MVRHPRRPKTAAQAPVIDPAARAVAALTLAVVLGGLTVAYGASPARAVDGGLLGAALALVLASASPGAPDTCLEATLVGAGSLTCTLKAALSRPAGAQRMAVIFGCIGIGVACVLLVLALFFIVGKAEAKQPAKPPPPPPAPFTDLEAGGSTVFVDVDPAAVQPAVSYTKNESRSRGRSREKRGQRQSRSTAATPFSPTLF